MTDGSTGGAGRDPLWMWRSGHHLPLGGNLVEVGALVTAPRIGQGCRSRVNPGNIDGSLSVV
jgi:hypothetical protein